MNIDTETVKSFSDEWSRFDQIGLSAEEAKKIFDEYFAVFPWSSLPANPVGFDMGCGSGRWAREVASRVYHLHCIDPSSALNVAKKMLQDKGNVSFHSASVDEKALPAGSQDFGYSLGVLHHVPDTEAAIQACVDLLKPNAPFLVYIYYAFDNRPLVFKIVWKGSDMIRRCICKLPNTLKHLCTNIIAAIVYWPLAKFSRFLEILGISPTNIPLSYYRNHSFYTMRTDSRDRFGTPLERRFTRSEIRSMMEAAGLQNVQFSQSAPYWCAVGLRR
jgi:ubiquinone/menaquinone biosynthesis C-methylase UbiE